MFTPPAHSERIAFSEKYPNLSSLLAWFICGQEDGKLEPQILLEYIEEESKDIQSKAVSEGMAFLAQHELPWTLIPDGLNFYQATKSGAHGWLSAILNRIVESLHEKH